MLSLQEPSELAAAVRERKASTVTARAVTTSKRGKILFFLIVWSVFTVFDDGGHQNVTNKIKLVTGAGKPFMTESRNLPMKCRKTTVKRSGSLAG